MITFPNLLAKTTEHLQSQNYRKKRKTNRFTKSVGNKFCQTLQIMITFQTCYQKQQNIYSQSYRKREKRNKFTNRVVNHGRIHKGLTIHSDLINKCDRISVLTLEFLKGYRKKDDLRIYWSFCIGQDGPFPFTVFYVRVSVR